jgi:hypothetical protein
MSTDSVFFKPHGLHTVKGKQIARVWHQFEGFKLWRQAFKMQKIFLFLTQVFIELLVRAKNMLLRAS